MAANYQLVMHTGPNQGKVAPLEKDELYIGRDLSNDIVINDAEVSRRHARLVLQAGGYVLEDLGSTNGTSVNGQRLMGPYTLRIGDVITLGEHVGLGFEPSEFDPDATVVSAAARPVISTPPAAPPPVLETPAPPPRTPPFAPTAPPQQAAGGFAPPQQSAGGYVPPQQNAGGYVPPQQSAGGFTPSQPSAGSFTPSQSARSSYTPPPAFSGQVPSEPAIEVPSRKPGRTALIAGLVVLAVACLCAVALYIIDVNLLWCTVFPFIPGCP